MIPHPLSQGISTVAKTIGTMVGGPAITAGNPAAVGTRPIEPTGAPVGAHTPDPFNHPPMDNQSPVGAPFPVTPEFMNQYRAVKKTYRRAKRAGTATTDQRKHYRTMKVAVRTHKGRPMKGRGVIGHGFVNESVKGGKIMSQGGLRRMISGEENGSEINRCQFASLQERRSTIGCPEIG